MNYILIYAKKTAGLENGSTIFRGDLMEVIPEDAQNAIQSGDVVHIDDRLYQEYSNKIDANYDKYKKKIEVIRNSEDPVYSSVDGKAKYDIKELEEERDKIDENLRKEYDQKLVELKIEAKKEQALSVDVISKSDENAAKIKVEVFKFEANTEGVDEALDNLLKYTQFAEDEAVRAIMPHIGEINAIIDAHEADRAKASIKKSKVVEAIKDSQPIDLESMMAQYPTSARLGVKSTIGKTIESNRADRGRNHVEKSFTPHHISTIES